MITFRGSKLQKKILAYFFTHPDESFYVRELAAFIDDDPGNVSRELKHLSTEGVLRDEQKGKTKLFALNKEYPFYNEFKAIYFKTVGVEGSLRALFAEYPKIKRAVLYGSYASGTEKHDSDVNVLMVAEGELPQEFTTALKELQTRFNRKIKCDHLSPERFVLDKAKEGTLVNTVVKGRHITLKGVLEEDTTVPLDL